MFRARFPIKEIRHITVNFNQWYIYGRHKGLDLRTKCAKYPNGIGTPIRAIADGEWKEVGKNKGKGNIVILKHKDGFESLYAHLERYTYQEGWKEVKCGDIIGYSGKTGIYVKGVHLHLELLKDGILVDPMIYIKKGDDLIEWAKNKNLLRVENSGTIHAIIDNKIIDINKDNVWETITNHSFGINENDWNDLVKLNN